MNFCNQILNIRMDQFSALRDNVAIHHCHRDIASSDSVNEIMVKVAELAGANQWGHARRISAYANDVGAFAGL